MVKQTYLTELKDTGRFTREQAMALATVCPICKRVYGVHDDEEMRICFPALCKGYIEPQFPKHKNA